MIAVKYSINKLKKKKKNTWYLKRIEHLKVLMANKWWQLLKLFLQACHVGNLFTTLSCISSKYDGQRVQILLNCSTAQINFAISKSKQNEF